MFREAVVHGGINRGADHDRLGVRVVAVDREGDDMVAIVDAGERRVRHQAGVSAVEPDGRAWRKGAAVDGTVLLGFGSVLAAAGKRENERGADGKDRQGRSHDRTPFITRDAGLKVVGLGFRNSERARKCTPVIKGSQAL